MKLGLKIIKLSLNMYKSMIRNLNSKIGSRNPEEGLVSALKNMNFKVRHDLRKIDESIEILWTEVKDRNKNAPVLSSKFKVFSSPVLSFI